MTLARTDLPLVLHTRVVTGEGGGPEKTILNSPRFLPELGYRSICAYMRPPDDCGFANIRSRAEQWHAPLVEIDDRGPLDFGVFKRLLAVCREQNVTIWHGHDYKSNLIGLWVRRYWPLKLVTTVHGWVKFTWRTPLYYAIDRFCLRRYDRVICVSDDLRQACVSSGVSAQRAIWIDNAIDTTEFQRRRSISDAKRALGFDPQRPLIGAVGRLSAEKGFDVLIRAFARIVQSGSDAELAIVGEGDQRPALQSLIAGLGLADRVRLLGFRADVRELFEAFDVFALSSLREGLPNVVLEALALQTPVVATAIAGVPRVLRDQENGLLVQPGDEAGLTTAIHQLLSDGPLCQRLAEAGRQTIEARFSFQRRMEKVARVYQDVLGQPS